MFFFLSKTLGLLTVPSNALVLLTAVGAALLLTRWRPAGRRILIFCLVVFLVVGYLPIGRAAHFILENRFPAWTDTGGPVAGIIILGGPVSPYLSETRGQVTLGDGAERLTEIPALARKFPDARIVYTGGNPRLFGMGTPEALYGARLLESFGIPRERIVIEGDSRNTQENAVFTKALVKPKPGERWLLVTSALHMPRSVGVFRKADFPIEPYPVDWHTDGQPTWGWLRPPLSPFGGWSVLDDAAKEWIGLVVYWLTGRTSELFPGSEPA
jgi:uncharacterized SAM-binding protein YcdF (DUF218 family)